MSYVKLHTVVQDFAVGVQSVNQATDNNIALHDQYLAKHTERVDSDVGLFVGRHDDRLIPRSVARYRVITGVTPSQLQAVMSAPLLGAGGLRVARMGTGWWRIWLTARNITAVFPQVESDADPLVATLRAVQAPGQSYVEVETWDVTTAAKVDADFSLTVWAYTL